MKICFSIYLKPPEALVLCSPASRGDLVPSNSRMGGYELFVGNQLNRSGWRKLMVRPLEEPVRPWSSRSGGGRGGRGWCAKCGKGAPYRKSPQSQVSVSPLVRRDRRRGVARRRQSL